MKHLGIDYGTKHIGLATSDAGGSVAMPHDIIPNTPQAVEQIARILQQEQIDVIVIGESKDFQGRDNTVQSHINTFVDQLKAHTDLPIEKTSELFSSKMAKWGTEHMIRFNPRNADHRPLHKKERRIDDKAAAVMLQSHLDSNQKS